MFDPNEFYLQAQNLLSEPSYREVCGRTAISRAYYSILLQAEIIIYQKFPGPLIIPREVRESLHSYVRRVFKAKKHGNISGKIYNLSQTRADADYDMKIAVSEGMAQEALSLADNIIELIKNV